MKFSKLFRFTVFLSLVLTGQSVFAGDPDCEKAWNNSSAKGSCTFYTKDINRNGESCVLEGYCRQSSGTQSINYNNALYASPNNRVNVYPAAVIKLEDVPKLGNCNGFLKVGSC
ncbi:MULTISPECIES: hypothetical protein [Pseudomonas]|uniref:hypothetical protein n=1 Tax=Pseudomonas TaxID=286 RepID=UPI0011132D6C|nr:MULTISPECIES: hypothetical protein [Pseudomonas]